MDEVTTAEPRGGGGSVRFHVHKIKTANQFAVGAEMPPPFVFFASGFLNTQCTYEVYVARKRARRNREETVVTKKKI